MALPDKDFNTYNINRKFPYDLDNSAQPKEANECQMWQQFLKGDDDALVYIYRKYVQVLFTYGQQFSRRHDFVQDCIQEMFFDLVKKRNSLSQVKSLRAYLLVSLRRRILRGVKKSDTTHLTEDGFAFKLSDQVVPLNSSLKEDDCKVIFDKINELPSSQREVIFLYFYEGLSYQDIAEILSIKVPTARTLTYRALDNLQKKLGPHLGSFYLLLLTLSQSNHSPLN